MKKLIFEGQFKLMIPDNWINKNEEMYVSLFNPQGIGAVRIEFNRRDEHIEENELEILALNRQHVIASKLDKYRLKVEFNKEKDVWFSELIFTQKIKGKKTYWRVCYFLGKTNLIVLSYNCDLGSEATEKPELDEIIKSVERD